jgi:hypothetical protein
MERTWKPTAAGILCIVVGGILLIPLVVPGIMPIVGGIYALRRRRWGVALAGSIVTLIAPVMIMTIAGLTVSWPPGIPVTDAMLFGSLFGIPGILAIIFVVKGKGEFE